MFTSINQLIHLKSIKPYKRPQHFTDNKIILFLVKGFGFNNLTFRSSKQKIILVRKDVILEVQGLKTVPLLTISILLYW